MSRAIALQWTKVVSAFPRLDSVKTFEETVFLHSKSPKVAEAIDAWPDKLPSWATRGWDGFKETGTLHGPPWSIRIEYQTPLWDQFFAKVVPSDVVVSPASGFLAPRGGCDNLCNDNERYTDYCDFFVQSRDELEQGDSWLVVRTEEQHWN